MKDIIAGIIADICIFLDLTWATYDGGRRLCDIIYVSP